MKQHLMRYGFLVLVILGYTLCGISLDARASDEIAKVHADSVVVRELAPEVLDPYLQDEAFDYFGEANQQPVVSWWDRLSVWVGKILHKLFFGNKVAANLWQLVPYILGLIAVVLIVLHLSNTPIQSLFSLYDRKGKVQLNLEEEHIEQIDLDTLLQELLAQKDYRSAVRIHFLKVLKKLSEQGLIAWKVQKTNEEYYRELPDLALQKQFRQLILAYDYIWYGQFELDEQSFSDWQGRFQQFESDLSQFKTA